VPTNSPELFDTLYCRAVASQSRAAARYHGDQAARPGMLDFAVNVRASAPPSWLVDRLTARLADLGRYPSAADEQRAVHAVAARHGRRVDDVALLAGLRVGYALGPSDVLDRMIARRPHWPLGTLQLEAIAACSSPEAVAEADVGARRLAALRAGMVAGLTSIGLDVIDGCAPFVLFSVPDAQLMRKHLDGKGIAVRRCHTFVGFDGDFLRAAVRPHWPDLVDAIAESAAMSGLREERVAS
jgi:histidinol-phosphate/aromatic aminotransferase/cobyric acid decarboxylase-like protein